MARDFALIGPQHWASFADAHVDDAGRLVLDWSVEDPPSAGAGQPVAPRGLAFDAVCRLYVALPEEGRVLRLQRPFARPGVARPDAVDLIAGQEAAVAGDFTTVAEAAPLDRPVALAIDAADRLFVAEAAGRIRVYDLWSGVAVRTIRCDDPPRDLAALGGVVYALLGSGAILELTARGGIRRLDTEPSLADAGRMAAAPDGTLAVLQRPGAADARVALLSRDDGAPLRVRGSVEAADATDLEMDADGDLVAARGPGQPLLRFDGAGLVPKPAVRAEAYGAGLVRTPGGRVAYWTAQGLRDPVGTAVRHETLGRAVSRCLDSGEFQLAWGRIFIDACVPAGARLRVACRTSDEADPTRAAPASPVFRPLHDRRTGRERPWSNLGVPQELRTFEAPVMAPPGRYLWLAVELSGDTRGSPAIHAVRIERPGHRQLGRLPRTYSREPDAADFLRRYLAGFDGFLEDLGGRAAARHVLVDPRAAPAEVLPWLAGFMGLLLDERWSECARRKAIAEAHWLFRFRGTVAGVRRFLEIGLESDIVLIEHFKLRGQGAALLSGEGPAFTTSILGGGFRVGGAVGAGTEASPMAGTARDAFESHAHRFTVIVRGRLDAEADAIARRILELHRPAHTLFELCTVDAGMRVGRGLHVELSSLIGPTAAFAPLRVGPGVEAGAATLGRGTTLGHARPGFHPGVGRVGTDTEVG